MNNGMKWIAMLLLLLLIGIFYFCKIETQLESERNQLRLAWKLVELEVQQRYTWSPNVISMLKGYPIKEREQFFIQTEKMKKIIGEAMSEEEAVLLERADENFKNVLENWKMTVSQDYPQVKENRPLLFCLKKMDGNRHKTRRVRKDYNEKVQSYNKKVNEFPTRVIAALRFFQEKTCFYGKCVK